MAGQTFWWGDEAVSMRLIPFCMAFGACVNAALVACTPSSGVQASFGGPILVTLFWLHGYYNAVGAQISVKLDPRLATLPQEAQTQAHLVKDRSLYNTLEQGVPFLVLLWLMAVFVDTALATSLGFSYAALRLLYPLAYAWYGQFSMLNEIITQPNYQVLAYFKMSLALYSVGSSAEAFLPTDVGTRFAAAFALFFALNIVDEAILWNLPGKLAANWNLVANKNKFSKKGE